MLALHHSIFKAFFSLSQQQDEVMQSAGVLVGSDMGCDSYKGQQYSL